MQIRKEIIEIFSSFLQFRTDWDGIWVNEPKLRRSMLNCLQHSPEELSEDFWILYWQKIWQSQTPANISLATSHLSACLQEVAYWAARKMVTSVSNERQSVSVADFFQIAIAQVHKIIKGFNTQINGNFKKYASFAFINSIKEELRIRGEAEICTNWSLLCKLSQKKLVESLQNLNLKPEIIDCYVLAWRCFKTINSFSEARATRKIPEPDSATWIAVADLYNSQRLNQSNILPPAAPEKLKDWITVCGKAARAYLFPKFISVDAPSLGEEDGQLLDKLPSFQPSGLTEMLAKEEEQKRHQERNQINKVLLKTLVKLDLPSQQLLQLYYGQGLTQQQIAQQLDMKQYTVSRRLSSHKQSLLLALGKWSETNLHYSLNSDVLNKLNTVLEEWLKIHYKHPDLVDTL